MPKTTAKPVKTLPFALLLAIRPAVRDRKLLATLAGGDKFVRTHAQLGAAFDLAANTIKQSWAPQGMPTRDDGKYSLIDVLRWRLDYLDSREAKRSLSGISDAALKRQLAEAEVRKMEAQADRIEREEAETMGRLINRDDAAAALRGLLAALAEHLDGLPDQIAPMLPLEIAGELTEELRNAIRRYLEQFKNLSARAIAQKGQKG